MKITHPTKITIGVCGMLLSLYAKASTVVIESNKSAANSLLQFSLNTSGSLTQDAEIWTQGKGVVDPSLALGPFDSDQEILVSKERALLFAVNTGSNSISVFHMNQSGGLIPVTGSPFDSHGVGPVSVGLSHNILTVVNKHNDPAQATDQSLPNYTTFRLMQDGSLVWTDSVVTSPSESSPSQALVTPEGQVLVGADFLGGTLRSFLLYADGTLQARSNLMLPANLFGAPSTPRLPLGLAAHPNQRLVYVGMPTTNKIGVYQYDAWGDLNYLNAISDSGNVVCWLLVNKQGTRLYASNTADPSVSVYDIATNPEQPTELQKITLNSMGGAYQIAISPDEQQLAVLTQRYQATTPQGQGNEIHILNMHADGSLEADVLAPTVLDLPPNTRPQGLVIY